MLAQPDGQQSSPAEQSAPPLHPQVVDVLHCSPHTQALPLQEQSPVLWVHFPSVPHWLSSPQWQAPSTQLAPLGQAWVHAPQCAALVCRLVSQPLAEVQSP